MSHGHPAGLESADSSGASDSGEQRSRREAKRKREAAAKVFQQCAEAAQEIGEWKLAREAEDAAARATGEG
jgi:hypothetical protein